MHFEYLCCSGLLALVGFAYWASKAPERVIQQIIRWEQEDRERRK